MIGFHFQSGHESDVCYAVNQSYSIRHIVRLHRLLLNYCTKAYTQLTQRRAPYFTVVSLTVLSTFKSDVTYIQLGCKLA